jgi:diacylglycerol kinase (ATP)
LLLLSKGKWTTLASVGREIIENDDGSLAMPHQWIEGASVEWRGAFGAKCCVCDKNCGSVLRLVDWRCM